MAGVGLPLLSAHSGEEGIKHIISFEDKLIIELLTSQVEEVETAGSLWHAGYHLAWFLYCHPEIVRGKRILEIGAGCGLAGIVAACLGADKVIITDLGCQMTNIQNNIDINKEKTSGCDISCLPLPFGDNISSLGLDYGFDIVLGADIAFDLSLHSLIVDTLLSVNKTGDKYPIALLSEEIRWKDIYQWYIDLLQDKFTTLIEEDPAATKANTNLYKSKCRLTILNVTLEPRNLPILQDEYEEIEEFDDMDQ